MRFLFWSNIMLSLLVFCSAGKSPGPREITAVTYNVHYFDGGYEGIRDTISRLNADVIALQEVLVEDDADMSKRLASALRYHHSSSAPYVNFGKSKWVLSFLSRYPITGKSENPLGERLRKAFRISVDVAGSAVSFTTVHLSPFVWEKPGNIVSANLERSKRRQGEITILLKWMGAPRLPSVILGDFNSIPMMGELAQVREGGYSNVYDGIGGSQDGTFQIKRHIRDTVRRYMPGFIIDRDVIFDYIFVSETIQPLKAYVDKSTASDHYPVVARIKIPD